MGTLTNNRLIRYGMRQILRRDSSVGEQRTENPCVTSSNLVPGKKYFLYKTCVLLQFKEQ